MRDVVRVTMTRLRNSLAVAALMGAMAFATAAPAASPSITGVWQQFDDDTNEVQALVTLTERAGVVEGVVTKLFPAPGEPANPVCSSCKGDKKDRPVLGLKVIERMKRTGEGAYEGGIITDPESGTEYNGKLNLAEDGKVLKVRGFVGVALFGRTQEWRRAP